MARIPVSRFHWTLRRLFWGKEVISWSGVRIAVNPGELHGFYPYFLDRYAEDDIDILVSLCRERRLLADVGANAGMLSLALVRACPWLEIVAFEPEPFVVSRLRENLDLNPDLAARIEIAAVAASDHDGTARMESVAGTGNIETGRLLPDEGSEAGAAIPTIRLDTFFEERARTPDIIKIDVEGHELHVLRGLSSLMLTAPPAVLYIEVHGMNHPKEMVSFHQEILDHLGRYHYHVKARIAEVWQPAPPPESWPDRLHLLATRDVPPPLQRSSDEP